VFHTERGWPVGKSMYAKVWREARAFALTPTHSVEILFRWYAKCLDGRKLSHSW
jgi:hypothetical protein